MIWDNRSTLHRGKRYDAADHRRHLRRVTTQDMASVDDKPEVLAALEAASRGGVVRKVQSAKRHCTDLLPTDAPSA